MVIADKAHKGKSTVSVTLTYFNSVAYMNFRMFLKFGKEISISKAQESPFSIRIIIEDSLLFTHLT